MKKIIAFIFVGMFPVITYGAGLSIFGLFTMSQIFIRYALSFIIALSVVWFVFNVFKYIIQTDEIKTKEARDAIVWGIIAIFVMISIWGLVAILQNTFQIFPTTSGPNIQNTVPHLQ